MNHDRVTRESQETAALYALGALSQLEALAFEAHLREGCAVCQAELEQFEKVVGAMGSAAPPEAPPAYLRDLLAARIERESPEPPAASVIPFPEKATPIQATTTPSTFRRTLLPWAVAAALLIALAYAFTTWRTERESLQAAIDIEKARRSETLDEISDLKQQLAKEGAASGELSQINSVLSSQLWRIIQLAGQDPAPESSAKVYWDVQGNRWVVTADLPPAPAGKVYQLWFVTATEKVSAGLITPNKTGHGFAVVRFPSNIAPVAAAAITLEPEGGSQQPTKPIYALGKVS